MDLAPDDLGSEAEEICRKRILSICTVDCAGENVITAIGVAPGDPDNSYLIQKLEGTAPGAQMPFGGTPLDPAIISNIRTWISNGAQR